MAKSVKLIAAIPSRKLEGFLRDKKLKDYDTMPQLNKHAKEAIREFIEENVGYENEPITCLSKYNGEPSELKQVGVHVQEILPVMAGTSLWQLTMPEDMVVSVSFPNLMAIASQMESAGPVELEILKDRLKERLSLGYSDGDEAVSFIPFIELQDCKLYALIDPSWEMSNMKIPGVEKVNLVNMNMF